MGILEQFNLRGKKAIVTGAAQGLGRAMAEGLHEAGAEIVILDIMDKAVETAKAIGADGAKASFVKCNLLDRNDLRRGFAEAVKVLGGRLDILVNNAGGHARFPTLGYKMEDWDRVMGINLNAVFLLCQLAGEVMVPQGSGKIINVSSVCAWVGSLNGAAYAASKGAVAQLTKSLCIEWASKGVGVNAIAPGYIAGTDLNKDMTDERRVSIAERIPIGHWGKPEDLKGMVVFLASEASNFVNGAVLPIDGGFLAR